MAADSMTISRALLEALRCPVTGGTLRLLPGGDDQLDPERFPEGALISEDGSVVYPIRHGLPVVLRSEATKPGHRS